jgi:triacylglycerol lipase
MNVPKLRAPVVLVHGVVGYDEIRLGSWVLARYFPGIPELLRAAGNTVLVPRLHPTAGTAHRAAELKAYLDRHLPDRPAHLIAHSLAGLDSRYAITHLGLAPRVLSLTTVATPHRGTTFADWGLRHLQPFAQGLIDFLRLPMQAFQDLTTTGCRSFNEQTPDAPGVRYFSVAANYDGRDRAPEWLMTHRLVLKAEGPNDGIVSLASARYGESFNVVEGDHRSVVNRYGPLSRRRDPAPLYAAMLHRLGEAGFA